MVNIQHLPDDPIEYSLYGRDPWLALFQCSHDLVWPAPVDDTAPDGVAADKVSGDEEIPIMTDPYNDTDSDDVIREDAVAFVHSFEDWLVFQYRNSGPREYPGDHEAVEKVHIARDINNARDGDRPNLVWIVKKIWQAGYIQENRSIYFTTMSYIAERAGKAVDPIDFRSALKMSGCPVTEHLVYENDLREFFHQREESDA